MTHPNPGGMEHGIGDGRVHPDMAQLAQAIDSQGIYQPIVLRHQDDLDLADIGMHRHQIVGKVLVGIAGKAPVNFGGFVQAGGDAQIKPPISWLLAVMGLTMRPAGESG